MPLFNTTRRRGRASTRHQRRTDALGECGEQRGPRRTETGTKRRTNLLETRPRLTQNGPVLFRTIWFFWMELIHGGPPRPPREAIEPSEARRAVMSPLEQEQVIPTL